MVTLIPGQMMKHYRSPFLIHSNFIMRKYLQKYRLLLVVPFDCQKLVNFTYFKASAAEFDRKASHSPVH